MPYLRNDTYRVKCAKYMRCYVRQLPVQGNGHWKHDDDGPENGRGQGHAHGYDKHYDKDQRQLSDIDKVRMGDNQSPILVRSVSNKEISII